MNKEVIKNGFQRAGIYPYSSDVIPYSMFDALSLKQWKETVGKQTKTDNPEIDEDPAISNILEAILHSPILLDLSSNDALHVGDGTVAQSSGNRERFAEDCTEFISSNCAVYRHFRLIK